MPFAGLIWFILTLLPLVLLQRLLHREIQVVLFLFTRNKPLTIGLFSMLFFPGVFLHELSHFLMAKMLGVRTGKFSLIPQVQSGGRLLLGYVETEKTDIVRDSLVGLAPLIAGTLFVAYAGVARLNLDTLWTVLQNRQMNLFVMGLGLLPSIPDFYLWSYLIFTVSSTMLPSESDRHAWLPLGLWIGALLFIAIFAGAGNWMLTNLAPTVDSLLRAVALLLGLSNILHVILFLPFYVLHQLMSYFMQMDIPRN